MRIYCTRNPIPMSCASASVAVANWITPPLFETYPIAESNRPESRNERESTQFEVTAVEVPGWVDVVVDPDRGRTPGIVAVGRAPSPTRYVERVNPSTPSTRQPMLSTLVVR